jgi:transposase
VNWKALKALGIVGIDEIALKKGHRDFVTIITCRVEGEIRLLAVLPDRKKATVKAFLARIPQRLRSTIQTVCSDMYDGYVNAAREVFGRRVKVVTDRFHVAKLYRKGMDELRKQELKRLKQELPKEDYQQLKGAMWALRKDKAQLSQEELAVLACLFICSPRLKMAYEFCHDLTAIFDEELTPAAAIKKINQWKRQVKRSPLSCFDDFLTTLDNHLKEIANYFAGRFTSGFVEGFNNKIKVIKRRCYGILNVDHLFQRIHLDLTGRTLFA